MIKYSRTATIIRPIMRYNFISRVFRSTTIHLNIPALTPNTAKTIKIIPNPIITHNSGRTIAGIRNLTTIDKNNIRTTNPHTYS